jgi:hypothetical protein
VDADYARKWITLSSLIITGAQMLFLIMAPPFGYPLEYPKNLNIIQIVTPVFLGYLGAATHFAFMNPLPIVVLNNELIPMLVRGPIIIYVMVVSAALFVFGYTNRMGAPVGSGMSPDNLSTTLSIALGILSATTAVIVSYLFVVNRSGDKT